MKNKDRIKIKKTISIIGKAFKISMKTKGKLSLFISLIGLGAALLPAIISLILQKFTNEIQYISQNNESSLRDALICFLFLSILFLIQLSYNFFRDYFLVIDSIRTNRYLQETILRYTCVVKYKYINNYDNFKEKISFIETHAGLRVANSVQTIFLSIQYLITFISIAYILINVSVWIVVALISTCLPSVLLSYMQKDETYIHNAKWIKEGAFAIHYFYLCSGKDALNDVRHFSLFEYLKERWKGFTNNHRIKKNRMTKKHVIYNSISDILRNIVFIVVLLIVGNKIYQSPDIGIGVFMLVLSASKQFQNTITKFLLSITQIFTDIKYMEDFFELEKFETDTSESNVEPFKKVIIKYNNVNFCYNDKNENVLKNINIEIKNGEKIAIVGENGSGKTTFINLLCGLYKPTDGEIVINGIDIQKILPKVRKSISVVFQQFGRYSTSIKENITISDKNREYDENSIYELAKLLDLYDMIISQPNKLDEEIGSFSMKENNLSGGQWQKIAILRALYKKNASIMILDEPTASLDPISEAKIYENFLKLTSDKTTILISHRLGVTSIVDRILVFKNGEIIEDGSHINLIKSSSYYKKLYDAQAKWYK